MSSVNSTVNAAHAHEASEAGPGCVAAVPTPGSSAARIPFLLVAGHVVLSLDGGQVLLDTGSPVSFGRATDLEFLGSRRRLARAPLGLSIEQIACEIGALEDGPGAGFELDALLGCDLLAGCTVEISWAEREVRVLPSNDAPPPTDLISCIPRMKVTVDGEPLEALVDTAAWVSYVRREFLRNGAPAGTRRDFVPPFGRFAVDLVRCPVAVGGDLRERTLGIAPAAIEAVLWLCGASAIVGTDILATVGTTRLEFRGGESAAQCLRAWPRR